MTESSLVALYDPDFSLERGKHFFFFGKERRNLIEIIQPPSVRAKC